MLDCFSSGSLNMFSSFKLRHSVHPQEPVAPKHSDFFEVSSRRRIRIIHIKPEKKENSYCVDNNSVIKKYNEKNRNTSLGEYWFTCWNRPLQTNNCNCSFRRKKNTLKGPDNILLKVNLKNSVTNEITNESTFKKYQLSIEYYVEKLINNALVIAYKECLNITPDVVLRKEIETPVQNELKKKAACAKATPKPAILLLHGIGSSAEVWWKILQCFVDAGHEVLAPDMLGHGFSSVPTSSREYTFKKLLKDIISIFDKYIGSSDLKQCIVIGHSFGCSLAAALARYRAQQIVQLVLISGGGPTPLAPLVSNNEMLLFNCLQVLIKPLLFCGIKRTMFVSSRGKHFKICDPDNNVPAYVTRYISEGQHWPEGDAAFHRRILIPTLLVHGLQDNNVTLVQECEMERTIPRSFLEIIPTAGHMCMLETPNQLCHMLLCFINWWNT